MEWLFKIIIILFLSLKSVGVQAQSLVVTSLPAVLFQTNGGIHNITAGSVIQLYCSVQSTTASFSWTKDGRPVVIDVPHLRERACNDYSSTISVLTVDNFRSSDDGVYQCTAVSGNSIGEGGNIELKAAINGSLSIIRHPTEDEELLEGGLFSEDNGTGIELGSQVSMNCTAETSNDALPIQISWIRDGNTVANDATHHVNTMDLSSNLQITNFALPDVGVYQCIFINSETMELITTIPFRLQTDTFDGSVNTILLERVSPEVIYLRPPEKLVIEIKATGRYRRIVWHKNGFLLPQQFPNHNEILVYGTTTQDDLGLYEVSLVPANPIFQRIVPFELDFLIVLPVDANTTITNGSDISAREGGSLTISCISTGAPTPSISWEFNSQPVMFQPMESVTGAQVIITRDPLTNSLIPSIALGTITSNLLIVNAQYPEYDGVFTCIGSNDNNTSSAMVNVHILVAPEVELTASHLKVGLGGFTTLLCNATRANPEITGAYIWRNENTGTTLSEQSDNLLVTFSTVNDFGTYSCTVINSAGEVGTGNLTITQGFSPLIVLARPLPEGPVIIDTTIELICTTTGMDPPRNITWTFNGVEIDTGLEITSFNISRQISGPDYGVYTCSASNEFGSDSETVEIIQAVAPTLAPITTDVEVEVGMPLTLSVNITGFNLEVTDIVWLNNNGTVISQTNDIYTITNSSLDAPVGTATLFVESVTSPAVYGGIYQVTISNPAGSDKSTFRVSIISYITTESFFQLRIFPVDDCVSWIERNNDQKLGEIRAHVADVIASACSCGFSATNITESVFSCRSSETQVVFKARLSYTSPAGTQTAEDLVMLVSSWVSSEPSLTVTGTVLSVDPTCPVELESLTDEDCLRPNLPMVSDALNVTTIWAGALGGVLAIAVMIVIVIIVLMLVRYSWRTKTLNISSSYELQPVAERSAAELEGTSPEYEVIPAFSETDNPTVQSNIAYGIIQLPEANNPAVVSSIQQQEYKSRRGDQKIPESIVNANSSQDLVNPSTQAHGTNEEEESAYY